MQKELDKFMEISNSRRTRKQREKALPSGYAPKYIYEHPERFGGRQCLHPVDVEAVKEIMAGLEEDYITNTDWGVPEEFTEQATAALAQLEVEEVTMGNVWLVFNSILHYFTLQAL